MAIVRYTNLADYVYDTLPGDNTYYLLKGEDEFHGYNPAGRDTVYGFDGADYIDGGAGNDTLYGETGADYLVAGSGFDTLYGGKGNDFVVGYKDDTHDTLFGGLGNDTLYADDDMVNAGENDDIVYVESRYDNVTDVTLGTGRDTLNISSMSGFSNTENRVTVHDFKAEDHLNLDGVNDYGYRLSEGVILDQLDVNNDGWLGAKDVVVGDDYDGFSVHTGKNYLELDVLDTSIVFQGVTNASFDFLA